MTDHQIGLDLCTDVLDVLHRHGFTRGDDEHAGRAIFLISDLARIYEGSRSIRSGPLSTRHLPGRWHLSRPARTAVTRSSSRPAS